MANKRYNFEREQREFMDKVLLQLPKRWAQKALEKHIQLQKISIATANHYFLDLLDLVEGSLEVGSSDFDLINLSIECVKKARVILSEATTRGRKSAVFNELELLESLALEYGVRWPVEHEKPQIIARLTCSAWWLRGLRKALNKKAEGAAIKAGLVHCKADKYVSDDTLERRGQQRRRNAAMLESVEIKNTETGEIIPLSAAAKAGLANMQNRKNELITRVKGFEELATKYGHAAEFITVTCPSRFHAVTSDGKANPKAAGINPSDAQKYLVECWARVRAKLKREGVRVYGMRIAEPHHDGTPHWHMILFYRKEAKTTKAIRAAFREHFLNNDNPSEAGAQLNRIKFVAINPLKGSAVGYVLKYVLKNVNALEGESYHDEALNERGEVVELSLGDSLFQRVEAWAACWNIRQFQQIGGHYVTVWRELRRIDESRLNGHRPRFVKAWQAAQRQGEKYADFAGFIESQGGLEVSPRDSYLRVDYDYIDAMGRYGGFIKAKVLGVGERMGRAVVATNRAEWVRV